MCKLKIFSFTLLLGTHQPEPLECVAIQGKIVFASYGNVIKAFKRGREVNTYLGHEGCVTNLIPFGEHLVSIDDQNCLKIWQIKKSGKLFLSLHTHTHTYTHTHTCIHAHTQTYIHSPFFPLSYSLCLCHTFSLTHTHHYRTLWRNPL